MPNPVTSPLLPSLNGRTLTVDVALNSSTILQNAIARLADKQILLPKFFREYGAKVEGGGMLYNSIQASDSFIAGSLEQRIPGAEYKVVEGVDLDTQLALVEDWGGKFKVPDEVVMRNRVNFLVQQTTQLANTITRKLDTCVVDTLQTSAARQITTPGTGIATVVVMDSWDDLVFVGPLDPITPSAARPTAHFAGAQELADLEELGATYDLLVVHPNQARALRTAYGEGLNAMLTAAGFTEGMFVSARIPAGTVYVCQKGNLGIVGFEIPLRVETWREPETRSWWVQAYVVPAFAVDRPYAAKKLFFPSDS